MATVVGWGRTGENKPVSDELRKVNVPILSQEECDQAGYQKNRLTDNMFCAGYLDGKRDACFVSEFNKKIKRRKRIKKKSLNKIKYKT